MTFQLYSKRYGELHYTPDIPLVATEHVLPGATLQCYTGGENLSYFLFQEIPTPGFQVRICHFYSFVKDTLILISDPCTQLRMGLHRSHDYYLPQLGRLSFLERGYNLLQVPHTLVEWPLQPQQRYAFLEIVPPPDLLQALSPEYPILPAFLSIADTQRPHLLCTHNQVAGPGMMSWLDLLLHPEQTPYTNDAIALQLLRAALHPLQDAQQGHSVHLPESDVEKVYAMADLLVNSEDAPSLTNLSDRFDMSVYRINNGFKQVYGHTALHHRKEELMRKALRLMHLQQCSVKQLAYTLGYWPQNFSRAFKKRFGYSPGQLV